MGSLPDVLWDGGSVGIEYQSYYLQDQPKWLVFLISVKQSCGVAFYLLKRNIFETHRRSIEDYFSAYHSINLNYVL